MKICNSQGCTNYVFAKGYCRYHQHFRTDSKPKRIKPKSKKLTEAEKAYSKLRKEFLSQPENIRCAVYPWMVATEIHHMRGRGKYLNNTKTWLAVSREGHNWIEANPKEARKKGWTLDRIAIISEDT